MGVVVDGIERRMHVDGQWHDGYFRDVWHIIGNNWFVALGSLFEWYEFFLYGYLAAPINVNFFRGNSTYVWAAYALTMGVRPIGALSFGWIGDNYGRRIAFLIAVNGMNICTALHGVLPSYYSTSHAGWGRFGFVSLLILRTGQGFFTGGQVGAAATSMAEIKDKRLMGSASGVLLLGVAAAIISASAISALLSNVLTKHQMNLWGWRLPFLIAIIPGIVAVLCRNSVSETEDFEKEVLHHEVGDHNGGVQGTNEKGVGKNELGAHNDVMANTEAQVPEVAEKKNIFVLSKELLTQYPQNCAIGFFGTMTNATWYGVAGGSWAISYVVKHGEITTAQALNAGFIGNVVSAVVVLLTVPFIDRYGVGFLNLFTLWPVGIIACILWAIMIANLDNAQATFWLLIMFCGIRSLIGGQHTFLMTAENYPTSVRMTGFFFYNLAQSVIGGSGPVLNNIAAEKNVWYPLIFIIFGTFIGGVAYAIGYWKHLKGTITTSYIRPELY